MAALSGISTDYYTRIEQPRGPGPSDQVLDAISRALRLTADEHGYLLSLAGRASVRTADSDAEVSDGLRRVFDLLHGDPVQIVNDLGETLLQSPSAVSLLGDETRHTGLARSRVYRWFTDPDSRRLTPVEDHAVHSRTLVARLAGTAASSEPQSRVHGIVAGLRSASPEFESLWNQHPVSGPYCEAKRIVHAELGVLELHGQTLVDPGRSQALTVFTAEPNTPSRYRLGMLTSASDRG